MSNISPFFFSFLFFLPFSPSASSLRRFFFSFLFSTYKCPFPPYRLLLLFFSILAYLLPYNK
ncbi:MAG: hypothetical protein JOS17DRAFT_763850 [Linnemannia elongata]|nr:MAG: hypothetical protein JOS17DRAFT_763850 [Linnemannia elongata]